jgi:hypothetical protein
MGFLINLFDKTKKAREIITTNPNLICEKCGKKPLIYDSDRYGVPIVNFDSFDVTGLASKKGERFSSEEFLKLSHLAYSGVAIKCPNCKKISCLDCYKISSTDRYSENCPICGSDLVPLKNFLKVGDY